MPESTPTLPLARAAWRTPDFAAALKRELEALGPAALPLQAALQYGSVVADTPIEIMVLGSTATAVAITVSVGVFFAGIIAGCNCADDPTPVEPQPEYVELRLIIDLASAQVRVELQ